MGKRRRTRAQKMRRDARRAERDAAVLRGAPVPAAPAKPAPAPAGPRTRKVGDRIEVLNFYVERQAVRFGFDHPRLRHATYGKTEVLRDGPFRTWTAARASIADGDAPGARIVSAWEDPQTKRQAGAFQNDDGTVTLVKADQGEDE